MASLEKGKYQRAITNFKNTWVANNMLDKRLQIVEHMVRARPQRRRTHTCCRDASHLAEGSRS